ncbi:hypothetical protein NPIL_619611 [Nephila pilipes]|uniref:Uncharacterized protein n=1 Tax=Nephila pilipes TaxID=299642 RepID=A0A8X6NT23_NEPPI|nr:hypothetical protein NPIL_619611 [Nephila pilipes]
MSLASQQLHCAHSAKPKNFKKKEALRRSERRPSLWQRNPPPPLEIRAFRTPARKRLPKKVVSNPPLKGSQWVKCREFLKEKVKRTLNVTSSGRQILAPNPVVTACNQTAAKRGVSSRVRAPPNDKTDLSRNNTVKSIPSSPVT